MRSNWLALCKRAWCSQHSDQRKPLHLKLCTLHSEWQEFIPPWLCMDFTSFQTNVDLWPAVKPCCLVVRGKSPNPKQWNNNLDIPGLSTFENFFFSSDKNSKKNNCFLFKKSPSGFEPFSRQVTFSWFPLHVCDSCFVLWISLRGFSSLPPAKVTIVR